MKIKLLLPIKTNKQITENFKKATNKIQKLGHEINDDVLNINPQNYIEEAEEDIVKVHKKIDTTIKTSDCIVAEVTEPSSGIGYLIAEALNLKKPVLALYRKNKESKLPVPIYGSKNKLLISKLYSKENLVETIVNFIDEVKKKLDTKFILIISPEIDRYLEWASDYKRMHKAQIVRSAVEKEIENDEEYQDYLKGE